MPAQINNAGDGKKQMQAREETEPAGVCRTGLTFTPLVRDFQPLRVFRYHMRIYCISIYIKIIYLFKLIVVYIII